MNFASKTALFFRTMHPWWTLSHFSVTISGSTRVMLLGSRAVVAIAITLERPKRSLAQGFSLNGPCQRGGTQVAEFNKGFTKGMFNNFSEFF